MIIKRKLYTDQKNFSWFDNFTKPNFNTSPITLKEVVELDKKYQGFILNNSTGKLNYKEEIKYWKRDNWKTFENNNKVKVLGIRKISDIVDPFYHYFYVYFDEPTVLLKLPSPAYYTVKQFIKKEESKKNTPNVKFLGKKIGFIGGSSHFNGFNIKKLEHRVKLDDFYDAILRFEGDFPTVDIPLNKNNIKSRIDYSVVWDNDDKNLRITFIEKTNDYFFWTFEFTKPDDPITVSYTAEY